MRGVASLQISLKSSLIEDTRISSASVFCLFWYVVLIEADEEKAASHRYVLGRWINTLKFFQIIRDIL